MSDGAREMLKDARAQKMYHIFLSACTDLPFACISTSPAMLGPRTRAAALRESACAAPVVLNNDGDEREPKKVKEYGATRTLASQAPAAQSEALAPSNLYAGVATRIVANASPSAALLLFCIHDQCVSPVLHVFLHVCSLFC